MGSNYHKNKMQNRKEIEEALRNANNFCDYIIRHAESLTTANLTHHKNSCAYGAYTIKNYLKKIEDSIMRE